MTQGCHRVAVGLERRGAGLLRGASGTGPAARAGEAGAGICLLSSQGPTVGRRLDSRRRRQLGAGNLKGLEFNVGRGGSGSGPGPAVVATGRQRAACPRPVIYGPEAMGPRRSWA